MITKDMAAAILSAGLLFVSTGSGTSMLPPQSASRSELATTDRDTMQKIRRALMDDKSLSTYAHNVKILVRDGQVTLRGPVRSDQEKKTVADAASAVAGADHVTNELTVQPSK